MARVRVREENDDASACAEDDVTIRVVACGDELCENEVDDDGDGATDCDDPECDDFDACQEPTSAGECNQPCGFDNTGPDETRAAALCDIIFPNDRARSLAAGTSAPATPNATTEIPAPKIVALGSPSKFVISWRS